ncbi:GIY-YIG nuclease family protein [Candidatus Bathyarchaeota archaeon]|nr:GIY-YIG nuclease family protein [Candidatus Bathyarchaeota archaeon]
MVLRGTYCLCISLRRDLEIEVGALGRIAFDRGLYVYVGSALSGLEARVRRHLRTSRGEFGAIHWHIDYLLREPDVEVERVFALLSDLREECRVAGEVGEHGVPVKGFGCSDCRCESHLLRVDSCDVLYRIELEEMTL